MDKFKLLTNDEKVGVWIDEVNILKVIKILKYRNKPLFLYYKEKYEKLTEKKLTDESLKYL
jgi:hypothetical protein